MIVWWWWRVGYALLQPDEKCLDPLPDLGQQQNGQEEKQAEEPNKQQEGVEGGTKAGMTAISSKRGLRGQVNVGTILVVALGA